MEIPERAGTMEIRIFLVIDLCLPLLPILSTLVFAPWFILKKKKGKDFVPMKNFKVY